MSKNAQTTQRAYMHKNIPYRYCYEEGGMIETERGVFTRTYEVTPPGKEVKGSYTGWLKESFGSLYGFNVKAMSLAERLELLYDIYHSDPGSSKFGSRVDYDGKGFSVKSMQRMRMDTKDTISPDKYECRERDYMKM